MVAGKGPPAALPGGGLPNDVCTQACAGEPLGASVSRCVHRSLPRAGGPRAVSLCSGWCGGAGRDAVLSPRGGHPPQGWGQAVSQLRMEHTMSSAPRPTHTGPPRAACGWAAEGGRDPASGSRHHHGPRRRTEWTPCVRACVRTRVPRVRVWLSERRVLCAECRRVCHKHVSLWPRWEAQVCVCPT